MTQAIHWEACPMFAYAALSGVDGGLADILRLSMC